MVASFHHLAERPCLCDGMHKRGWMKEEEEEKWREEGVNVWFGCEQKLVIRLARLRFGLAECRIHFRLRRGAPFFNWVDC